MYLGKIQGEKSLRRAVLRAEATAAVWTAREGMA